MTSALVLVIVGYSVLVGAAAAVVAARRTGRPGWLRTGAWMLQLLLLGQALIAGATVLRGAGPARPALFLAYLGVSVALLPLCGAMTTSNRVTVRSDAALAVAAVIAVVVQWRLVATWRGAHA